MKGGFVYNGATSAASGVTAYDLARVNGFTGTVDDWLDSLVGETVGAWTLYAAQWDAAPSKVADIAGGSVWSYTHEGVARYRFVPSPYAAAQDAFYSDFDGTTLSGLLAARGQ